MTSNYQIPEPSVSEQNWPSTLADTRLRILGKRGNLIVKTTLLVVLLTLSFFTGLSQWDQRSADANFYQRYFKPAVSIACGHGFQNIASEKQGLINNFVTQVTPSLSCQDAFGPDNDPQIGELKVFQKQTISLQYLFGYIWKYFGIDWDASKYVVGGFMAATALSMFVLARQLLGTYPSLIISGLTVRFSQQFIWMPIQIRDYSKATFVLGLAALFVSIVTAERRNIIPLSLLAVIIVSIGTGFRTDVSVFLVLIPLAISVHLVQRKTILIGIGGLLGFGALAWVINTFILNFTGGLGTFNAHFAVLGHASAFMQALGFEAVHQGAYLWYNDSVAFNLVSLFADSAGMPIPVWGGASYDAAGNAFLVGMASMLPANYLMQGFVAAFRSMFFLLSEKANTTLICLVASAVLIPLGYQRRGVAFLAIGIVIGGLSGIQFHPRHYFHIGVFGTILLCASGVVILSFLLRFAPSWTKSEDVLKFVAPNVKKIQPSYGLIAPSCLVMFALALLLARPYQQHQVGEMIERISRFPKTELSPEIASNANARPDVLVYSGKNFSKSSYVSIKKVSKEQCENFPKISEFYTSTNSYYDWSLDIPLPHGRIDEVYFPIILQSGQNTIKSIELSNIDRGCNYSVSIVHPTSKFLPMIYYSGDIKGADYYTLPLDLPLNFSST